MVIFHSYVSLPEGNHLVKLPPKKERDDLETLLHEISFLKDGTCGSPIWICQGSLWAAI